MGASSMIKEIQRLADIETPPGIYDIQASFTLSLFWSLIGMVPATVYSASVYYNGSTEYYLDGQNASLPAPPKSNWKMTPITTQTWSGLQWAEPFAGPSNFAFFSGGVGIFLMPAMSGDYMPAPMFAVAVFLCILGGASGSFHADGSQTGTWQHIADRYAMCVLSLRLTSCHHTSRGSIRLPSSYPTPPTLPYVRYMPFGFLVFSMINALVHAIRGRPQHPRSAVAFLTNIGGMSYAIYCLIDQQSIDSMLFLIGTGFVIFTLESFAIAFLHYNAFFLRASETDSKNPPSRCKHLCVFFQSALLAMPPLLTRLLSLGIGFYCNAMSASHMSCAVHGNDCPGVAPGETPSMESRIEERRLHDFTHGTWHFLTSFVLTGLGLSLVQGLSGTRRYLGSVAEIDAIDTNRFLHGLRTYLVSFLHERRLELRSMGFSTATTIVFLVLVLSEANSRTWMATWVALGSPSYRCSCLSRHSWSAKRSETIITTSPRYL